jgi:hypothetical protein
VLVPAVIRHCNEVTRLKDELAICISASATYQLSDVAYVLSLGERAARGIFGSWSMLFMFWIIGRPATKKVLSLVWARDLRPDTGKAGFKELYSIDDYFAIKSFQ